MEHTDNNSVDGNMIGVEIQVIIQIIVANNFELIVCRVRRRWLAHRADTILRTGVVFSEGHGAARTVEVTARNFVDEERLERISAKIWINKEYNREEDSIFRIAK